MKRVDDIIKLGKELQEVEADLQRMKDFVVRAIGQKRPLICNIYLTDKVEAVTYLSAEKVQEIVDDAIETLTNPDKIDEDQYDVEISQKTMLEMFAILLKKYKAKRARIKRKLKRLL